MGLQHHQLLTFDPGKSGFGSNYKTVFCRVYKCEEGDFNTKGNPLGHEPGQVPADGVWSSDHEAIVNRENVSEDVLADATTHTYNASKEIKAAPELYSIDGGRFGERAREIEAEKEAERQAAREELAAKITGMDKEQQA